MAIFYKGAGVGNHWHTNDPRHSGFTARSPSVAPSSDRILTHIAEATTTTPYISLTKSYGVALGYALSARTTSTTTAVQPGYVWEIQLNEPLPSNLKLIDPVVEQPGNRLRRH